MSRLGNTDRMPERMTRCSGCGAVDRSCNYACPAERLGGERLIEYVRTDLHRGAVDLVRVLGSAWRANDDEAISNALVALEAWAGLREQGGR